MAMHNRLFLLGCLIALLAACASVETAGDKPPASPANAVGLSRDVNRILVTFQDERHERVPIADPANAYRQHGDYQNSAWSRRIAAQLAEQYGLNQVAQWPITVLGIHCVVYDVPPDQPLDTLLRRLEEDERVEAAQTMKDFHAMANGYSDPYFRLQTGARAMHIDAVHRIATGSNVKIAVIDTGMDAQHPDLAGQIAHEESFVGDSPIVTGEVHGTAVAGIIAAVANNGLGIVGIAPQAKLMALKACAQTTAQAADAVCNTFTLALALNTAITLRPSIINLSLTGPRDPLLERLIDKAVDEGIIVVASDPGHTTTNECFPGCMERVIAVRSAHEEEKGGVRASFIAAPGQEILTTLPQGTYNFMSGSSFAAAHVSGLIALLLELRPKLTSSEIMGILQKTSVTALGKNPAMPMVDACGAIKVLRGGDTQCHRPGGSRESYSLATQ